MIKSVQNELVKQTAKLNKSKYRKQDNQYLVYGETIVQMASDAGCVQKIFACDEKYFKANIECHLVSESVMKKILDGTLSQVCAVVNTIDNSEFDSSNILILDAIQDPGNLGTIIRSARAFGFNNIWLGQQTVDLYNDKVIRSMQGVNFEVNIRQGDIEDLLTTIDIPVITTYLNQPNLNELKKNDLKNIANQQIALMIGNEGNGINEKFKSYSSYNYQLAIEFESLNVAIAAAIIMYELKSEE